MPQSSHPVNASGTVEAGKEGLSDYVPNTGWDKEGDLGFWLLIQCVLFPFAGSQVKAGVRRGGVLKGSRAEPFYFSGSLP